MDFEENNSIIILLSKKDVLGTCHLTVIGHNYYSIISNDVFKNLTHGSIIDSFGI